MRKHIIRGFTLIELLVVIAIIAVLASVILASLNSARQKGGDAAIKANLDSIRTQAQLYYDDNGGFTTTAVPQSTTTAAIGSSCGSNGMFSDPTITAAITAAGNAGQNAATLNTGSNVGIACGATPNYYAIAVVLKTDPGQAWCIDSSGQAKEVAVSASTFTAGNGCE